MSNVFGWDASHYDWGRGPMELVAVRAGGVTFFTYDARSWTVTI